MNFLIYFSISYLAQLFVEWRYPQQNYGHRQLYPPSALYGAMVCWELRALGTGWALSAGLVAVAGRMFPGAIRLFICQASNTARRSSVWWVTLILEIIGGSILCIAYYNTLQK